MASRAELESRAAKANVDWTLPKYNNDSVLEQAIIYAESTSTTTSTATTKAISNHGKTLSGGRNV